MPPRRRRPGPTTADARQHHAAIRPARAGRAARRRITFPRDARRRVRRCPSARHDAKISGPISDHAHLIGDPAPSPDDLECDHDDHERQILYPAPAAGWGGRARPALVAGRIAFLQPHGGRGLPVAFPSVTGGSRCIPSSPSSSSTARLRCATCPTRPPGRTRCSSSRTRSATPSNAPGALRCSSTVRALSSRSTTNYEVLGYPAGAPAREARYTRYVDDRRLLRTHMTAMVPEALRRLARPGDADDVVVACPGLVYRRDVVDRLHVGEPHQLDLWRVRRWQAAHHRRPGRDDRPRRLGRPARGAAPDAARGAPVHDRRARGRGRDRRRAGSSSSSAASRARTSSRRAGSTPRSGRGSPWASASTARSCCARA